jgi:hypothetical protein
MRKLGLLEISEVEFDLKSDDGISLVTVSRRGGLVTYLAGSIVGCFTPDSVIRFLIKDDGNGKPAVFVKIRMIDEVERDWPCCEIVNASEATQWVDTINRFYEDIRSYRGVKKHPR